MGTGSFLRANWPGPGVEHLPPYSTQIEEKVELYLYSSSVVSKQVKE